MRSNAAQTASVARRPRSRGDPQQTVVWVRGEQDISTRDRLTLSLAKAAARDAGDIVVDLSGVTFMDASTIGALVAARNMLRVHARSLTFRHPSQAAQRLLDLCGLTPSTDDPAPTQPPIGSALGTWVRVPHATSTRPPSRRPARSHLLRNRRPSRWGEPSSGRSIPQRRALP